MTENKLTMEAIEKSGKHYENIKHVEILLEIPVGKDDSDNSVEEVPFAIGVQKIFDPVGISQFVKEFIGNIDRFKKSGVDIEEIQVPYFIFLMVKYFTELKDHIPDQLENQLVTMRYMTNNGALLQLFLHFDEQEINRIKEEIEVAMVTFDDNINILKEVKDYAKDKIRNRFLMD